jgi:DNA gyrase subunit A
MRVVIELRRGEVGEVVLNNLYAQTQMESVFGINWWRWSTASPAC